MAKKWALCCQSTLGDVDEFEVRLVHQRGGLQRVSGALVPQVVSCDAPQGAINVRRQPLQRVSVSLGPGAKQLRCF
jgi:hypothetical protein